MKTTTEILSYIDKELSRVEEEQMRASYSQDSLYRITKREVEHVTLTKIKEFIEDDKK